MTVFDHPFGPAAGNHVRTLALVAAITRKNAESMAADLGECTTGAACPAVLHHLDCPVHP